MDGNSLPKKQYLTRRGSRFYLRRRVPDELREALGKTEVVESLKTSDRREAQYRLSQRMAELDAEFERLRRPRSVTVSSLNEMTFLHIDDLVGAWAETELQEEHLRAEHDRPDEEVLSSGEIAGDEHDLRSELSALRNGGDPSLRSRIEAAADRLLIESGFPCEPLPSSGIFSRVQRVANIDKKSPKYDYLCRKVANALERILSARLLLSHGGSAAANSALGSSDRRIRYSATNLGNAIDGFKADRARRLVRPKTELDTNVAIRVIEEVLGREMPLEQIDIAACRRVISIFERLPVNAAKKFPKLTYVEAAEKADQEGIQRVSMSTAGKNIRIFSSILNWAVDEGMLDRNPVPMNALRGRRQHDEHSRSPFTTEQLRRIFSAPLYAGCVDDEYNYMTPGPNRPRGARFFIPLLALYHGCRLNELCQLRVDDVISKNGILALDLTAKKTDQRVKNSASKRIVPLHETVLRAGFEEFVESMRAKGEERLWPELEVNSRGYYSDAFQKWFSRFLEKADAREGKKSFHCFRHNFRDAAREASMESEMARALGGWTRRSIDEFYGAGPSVERLKAQIDKISYEGLDLSHLFS